MPFIQRNSTTLTNVVYTTGNYSNPNWITSISPSKVGSGTAQWNAAQLRGYEIGTGIPYTGAALSWNGFWGPSGVPIPQGGLEGQIISKNSDSNYDISWIDNYAPDVRILCKNGSGGTINRGEAVMAIDATGDRIIVAKSVADGSVNPKYMLGVAFENILDEEEGYVTLLGEITNINTNSYDVGDILWLDPANSGGYTTTEPGDSNVRMSVAIVTRKNSSSGRMFVRMWTQQPSLVDLFDLAIESPSGGQTIVYNSASGHWENSGILIPSYTATSGVAISGTQLYMSGTGNLNSLSLSGVSANPILSFARWNGTTVGLVDASGRFSIGGTGSTNQLEVNPLSSTTKGVVVKSAVSQTANLLEIQDSSSTPSVWVSSSGVIGQALPINSIGIGSGAIVPTGGYNIIIGDSAGYRLNLSSSHNVFLVTSTSSSDKFNYTPVSSGKNNVIIGRAISILGESSNNIGIGGTTYDGAGVWNLVSGEKNTVLGAYNTIYGVGNVAIGSDTTTRFGVGGAVPDSRYCIAIGSLAGNEGGRQAGTGLVSYNIFIGTEAGRTASGSYNIGVGNNALGGFVNGVIGSYNVEIITDNTQRMFGLIERTHDRKINIQRVIAGDTSSNRLTLGYVSQSGHFSPGATVQIVPKTSSDKILLAKGAVSQSENTFEVQNASGDPLFVVSNIGVPYTTHNGSIIVGTGISQTGWYTRSVLIGNCASNALNMHQIGSDNISIGYRSIAYSRGSGNGNVLIGTNVANNYDTASSSTLSNNVIIGNNANNRWNNKVPRDYNVMIGPNVGNWGSGSNNTYLGSQSAWANGTIGLNGNYNIEICNRSTNNIHRFINNLNDRLNIEATIAGDLFGKKLTIGNVSTSGHFTPDATLQIVPKVATDKVLIARGTTAQSANLIEAQDSSTASVFSVSPVGLVSGISIVSSGGIQLNSGIPSSTTNKLYASGTSLFWAGNPVYTGVVSSYSAGSGLVLSGTEFRLGGTGTLSEFRINSAGSNVGITIQPTGSQSVNFFEIKDSGGALKFAVGSNGAISGAISPNIITSAGGITLSDEHHGMIIEQTGVAGTGIFTLGNTGQITIPGWNCMVINIGSGAIIGKGSNTLRCPGNASGTRTQYSSVSVYRRSAGDFVLTGDLA